MSRPPPCIAHDQFDFVMQILGQRRVADGGAIRLDHVGVLGDKKRRRALVISHLRTRVRGLAVETGA